MSQCSYHLNIKSQTKMYFKNHLFKMEKAPFPFHLMGSLHSINLGTKVLLRLFNWLSVFLSESFQTDNVFGSSKSLRPHTNYSFSLPSRVLGRSILVARLARHTNQP